MVINNYISRLKTSAKRGDDVLADRVRNTVKKEKDSKDIEDILRMFELIAEKAEKAGLDGEFIFETAYEEAYSL